MKTLRYEIITSCHQLPFTPPSAKTRVDAPPRGADFVANNLPTAAMQVFSIGVASTLHGIVHFSTEFRLLFGRVRL